MDSAALETMLSSTGRGSVILKTKPIALTSDGEEKEEEEDREARDSVGDSGCETMSTPRSPSPEQQSQQLGEEEEEALVNLSTTDTK